MGLIDVFRRKPGSANASATMAIGTGSRYEATGWTFNRVAQSVLANPTGARCVDIIQSNFSRPDWVAYKPGSKGETEAPALIALLNKPNPKTSGAGMRRSIGRDITTCGKSFWFRERGRNGAGDRGPTTGLQRLAPQRCTVIGDEDDLLLGFIYSDRNGSRLPILPEDMLYLRYPHPEREYDGMAPALVAGLPAEIDNNAARFNYDLLANDGAVPGYLTVKNLTSAQLASFSALWDQHAAPGRTRILGGDGVVYAKVGQTNQELSYSELRDQSQHDVARGFGVPWPILEPTDTTFTNMSEARATLWQHTILPGLDLVGDDISVQLAGPEYGVDIHYKLDAIEELNEAEDALINRLNSQLDRKVIVINEYREAIDRDPVAWGNEPQQPIGPMKIQPGSADNGAPLLPDGSPAPPEPGEQDEQPPKPLPVKPKPKSAPIETKAAKRTVALPDFHRRVEAYEARMQRKMAAFFKRQGRVISAKVRAQSGKSHAKALSQDSWWDGDRWNSELADELDGTYSDTVDHFATDLLVQLGAGSFNPNAEAVRRYIESRVAKDSVYVNDTTVDEVRSLIADHEAAGESIQQIASAIAGYFSGDDAKANYRAELVARTTVIGASNYGLLAAADQSGIATGKSWLTAGGGECDSCASIDGEEVGLDESFSNGDDQPPDHPACRCTLLVVTADGTMTEDPTDG